VGERKNQSMMKNHKKIKKNLFLEQTQKEEDIIQSYAPK
jgi:hypothetical protein